MSSSLVEFPALLQQSRPHVVLWLAGKRQQRAMRSGKRGEKNENERPTGCSSSSVSQTNLWFHFLSCDEILFVFTWPQALCTAGCWRSRALPPRYTYLCLINCWFYGDLWWKIASFSQTVRSSVVVVSLLLFDMAQFSCWVDAVALLPQFVVEMFSDCSMEVIKVNRDWSRKEVSTIDHPSPGIIILLLSL